MKRKKKATKSRTSPKGGKRGCLCPDGKTYSTECCDGTLEAQGVGSVTMGATDSAGTITATDTEISISSDSTDVPSQSSSTITVVDTTVTITNTSS